MLKEKLLNDLKEAMKEKDIIRKNTVQAIRTAVLQVEKDKGIEVTDEQIIDIIAKESKKRKDAAVEFEKSGREDLIEQNNKELEELSKNYIKKVEDYNILKANIFNDINIVKQNIYQKNINEIQEEIQRIGARIATEGRAEQIDLEIEESTEHDSIIKGITSSDNTIQTLITIVRGVRITILVIFAILLIISVTIISNTIKLSVHARRKEISIMKYVGATNGFIKWPFIIEGIIIGIILIYL